MNIEFRFLQKAIADKNYKNIKPLKLDDKNKLHCDKTFFDFEKIKKLQILKDKF